MARGKNKLVEFCEKVAEHIKMADLPGVVLRIWGTKKHGKGLRPHDGKWVGEVTWNPVDDENPDQYHVGEFLAASEKVERQCPRLEIGKYYAVTAYDPENNEEIGSCIVCAGDPDDAEDEQDDDPLRVMSRQLQQALTQKMVNEISGQVESITGTGGNRGRRVTAGGTPQGGGGSNEGLIKLDDGSYVTKEWLMASLVQQRQANRRMQDELSDLREWLDESQDSRRNGGGGENGSGGAPGGGWMKTLMGMAQTWLENRAKNPPPPGQAAGVGIPVIDQLIGNVAPGFVKMPQQTVGGAGGFEQNNPFGGSLLASMDLSSPGSMGAPEAPQQQSPMVPFGGQLGPMAQNGMAQNGMAPGMGQPMPQPQQPQYGQMQSPHVPQQDVPTNPMFAPSPMMQGMQGTPMPQTPGAGGSYDDYDDYDDDEYYEDDDMSVTPETRKLADSLLEQLLPVVAEGGNKYEKEQKAKAIGARLLVPLAEQAGITKEQLAVFKMDPDTFADILIASISGPLKSVIEMKKNEVKPVMISVLQGMSMDS